MKIFFYISCCKYNCNIKTKKRETQSKKFLNLIIAEKEWKENEKTNKEKKK